jgi:hypothetical protein
LFVACFNPFWLFLVTTYCLHLLSKTFDRKPCVESVGCKIYLNNIILLIIHATPFRKLTKDVQHLFENIIYSQTCAKNWNECTWCPWNPSPNCEIQYLLVSVGPTLQYIALRCMLNILKSRRKRFKSGGCQTFSTQ